MLRYTLFFVDIGLTSDEYQKKYNALPKHTQNIINKDFSNFKDENYEEIIIKTKKLLGSRN